MPLLVIVPLPLFVNEIYPTNVAAWWYLHPIDGYIDHGIMEPFFSLQQLWRQCFHASSWVKLATDNPGPTGPTPSGSSEGATARGRQRPAEARCGQKKLWSSGPTCIFFGLLGCNLSFFAVCLLTEHFCLWTAKFCGVVWRVWWGVSESQGVYAILGILTCKKSDFPREIQKVMVFMRDWGVTLVGFWVWLIKRWIWRIHTAQESAALFDSNAGSQWWILESKASYWIMSTPHC